MSSQKIQKVFKTAKTTMLKKVVFKTNNSVKKMVDSFLSNFWEASPVPEVRGEYSMGRFVSNTRVHCTVYRVVGQSKQSAFQFSPFKIEGGSCTYTNFSNNPTLASKLGDAFLYVISNVTITNSTQNPKNGYPYYKNVQYLGWGKKPANTQVSFLDQNIYYTTRIEPYQPFMYATMSVKQQFANILK